MRRYEGFICDSSRWEGFPLRDDDVIITTPSKCGTTWMQNIVGMLIHDRVELGVPMGMLSPWLDMRTRSIDEIVALLEAQDHRRFIKSHTPLDGLPRSETVTYLAVLRHPLDVALSNRDHLANLALERAIQLRTEAEGDAGLHLLGSREAPENPADWLRFWIDGEAPAQGTGAVNLRDLALQALTYWEARDRPNVHLFHYSGLEADLAGQMQRVADALGVTVADDRWPEFVEAASFGAMKARAADLAPEAHLDFWHSTDDFFRKGGRRGWRELLPDEDVAHFHERLRRLVGGDCARWVEDGVIDET